MVSPFACENLFAAFTSENKKAAFEGIVPYLADCRVKNRKTCDFSTYLKEKRWQGRPVAAAAFPVKGGTPQAFRWLEYRGEQRQPTAFMEECWRTGKPWYAPTEWPPAKGHGDRTQPQQSPASPEETEYYPDLAREMGG